MKETLIARARALGFDVCRVAPARPARHGEAFREWLDAGCEGDMAWLQREPERRIDPELVLPGARSVVVVGMSYFQGAETQAPDRSRGPAGRIARYAWGDDYHDLMLDRLRALSELMATFGGTQKCYVDTGPILERDVAAEAGAGWHGKSTMLIHPRLGTWFFLGEILTTLSLEPDAPLPDRCGSCTRCVSACPTAAITSPHRLDARRCISYLTIELKGSIPLELRPLIGDRIYGCDDCLEACPWNRFAQASRETAFQARPATSALSLRDYLALDDDAFRRLFRGSPIKRIKRRGLLRNVCVALGNVGTEADLPALHEAATDPEPLIAEHARWAIDRICARRSDRARPQKSSPTVAGSSI